eukprot:scaffold114736_cov17-Prasinocladus_malaysianus.AAC.1
MNLQRSAHQHPAAPEGAPQLQQLGIHALHLPVEHVTPGLRTLQLLPCAAQSDSRKASPPISEETDSFQNNGKKRRNGKQRQEERRGEKRRIEKRR